MPAKQNLLNKISTLYKFIRHDIWRITGSELSKTRRYLYNSIKTVVLAFRGFSDHNLETNASALTYYTLFAIIPVLALILGIGRGFGFHETITDAIASQISVQADIMPIILEFIERYTQRTHQGIFIGIGFFILLWSVMSGFQKIEGSFNLIWGVKKSRSFVSQFATYFSIMFIFPIFIIASSGLSVFLSTNLSDSFFFGFFSPLSKILLKLSPYFINWILFTGLFIIVPNTRVRFLPALFAGVITGTLFQLFQHLYIQGQVLLSSYNVIYGGFAIIPLLLLWLQASWLIVLFGAELSFASQNISKFEFEADSKKITPRYKKFLIISILQLIIHRFINVEKPYTAQEISKENAIPIRLVNEILSQLVELHLINEVINDTNKEKAYQPAIDIHIITISFVLEKLAQQGSENFNIDSSKKFRAVWQKLEAIDTTIRNKDGATLIKDL